MKLNAITIENFKALRAPLRVELRPVTLLFGPNSAGKSSVIQALAYARHLLAGGDAEGRMVRLGGAELPFGGFEAFLTHGTDPDRQEIRLGFEVEYHYGTGDLDDGEMAFVESSGEQTWLDYEAALRGTAALRIELVVRVPAGDNRPALARVEYHSRDCMVASFEVVFDNGRPALWLELHGSALVHALASTATPDASGQAEHLLADLMTPTYDNPSFGALAEVLEDCLPSDATPARMRVRHAQQLPPARHEALRLSGWNGDVSGRYSDSPLVHRMVLEAFLRSLLFEPLEDLRSLLDRHLHIGPLRTVNNGRIDFTLGAPVGPWIDGTAAWNLLGDPDVDEEVFDALNHWLEDPDRFDTPYALSVSQFIEEPFDVRGWKPSAYTPGYDATRALGSRITLRDRDTGTVVGLQNVGVGLSQILPVIVAALTHSEGLISIEQPELHLHPRMQLPVADLCLETARARGQQWLIETHSEHLILRLLRRVREEGVALAPREDLSLNEQLAVYCLEPGREGTTARRLRINRHGEFVDPWPRSFFEERYDELP